MREDLRNKAFAKLKVLDNILTGWSGSLFEC